MAKRLWKEKQNCVIIKTVFAGAGLPLGKIISQSTNNFRWVDYPPTDNGDLHKTQVIKLQEMK